MMSSRVLLGAVACLTALPLMAQAQPSTTPASSNASPVTLRYKFKAGETRRYKITMDMSFTVGIPGAPAGSAVPIAYHLEMVRSQTVQSIRPSDGAATVVSQLSDIKGTTNGQPIPNLDQTMGGAAGNSTSVITPAGKTLSIQMPPAAPGTSTLPGMEFGKMGGMIPNAFPDNPVKVGDTWHDTLDMSQLVSTPMSGKFTISSSLTGISAAPKNVADVHQTIQGSIDSKVGTGGMGTMTLTGQVTGDSLIHLDVDSGSINSQDNTLRLDASMAMPQADANAAQAVPPMKINAEVKTHTEQLPALPAAKPAP